MNGTIRELAQMYNISALREISEAALTHYQILADFKAPIDQQNLLYRIGVDLARLATYAEEGQAQAVVRQ